MPARIQDILKTILQNL